MLYNLIYFEEPINQYWILPSSNPTTTLSKTFPNQDSLIVDVDEPEPIKRIGLMLLFVCIDD